MKKLITLVVVILSMCCFVAQASCAPVQTVSMSGTFNMNFQSNEGSIFDSILGNDNGWSVLLVDPRTGHFYSSSGNGTTLSAYLFNFQFTGEDADLLNSEIAPYFEWISFEVRDRGTDMEWRLDLESYSYDYYDTLWFSVEGTGADLFELDADGFPIIPYSGFYDDIDLTTLSVRNEGIRYNFAALNNGNSSIVPIPSTVWLLGSAFIGLVGFRRKYRKI
jgi:hypothetical protein